MKLAQDSADRPDIPASGFSDPGLDESESRARRALGLGRADQPKTRGWNTGDAGRRQGSATHHKSRFVQDGEVPVVVVSNRPGRAEIAASPTGNDRSRIADAEAALRRERAAREQAERELNAAQGQVRDLQTRLAHAELARDEAQAAERAAVERLEAMPRVELYEDRQMTDGADDLASPRPRRGRPRLSPEAAPRRGRASSLESAAAGPELPLPSDQPVKWWLDAGDDGEDDDDDE